MSLRRRLEKRGFMLVSAKRFRSILRLRKQIEQDNEAHRSDWAEAGKKDDRIRDLEAENAVWKGISRATAKRAAKSRIELEQMRESAQASDFDPKTEVS